ncbi:DNA polymerase III subunit beta [Saccharothrix coeruleofusca]|uniref:DNA polymerase III subunit beta n=1 Tax=Saccharothrix coeruleofusca TaxID=33919 RepID=A0A918AHA9_9PSEU|nr:DNA polymerase III subunit beta [Saccharothrix coeruleofusca]MBP2340305.1 DNA polymerase-3 subunit beta [Saccharothrix coeruleofusca]GGP36285.1 DNA polymerase III subunit beta [Saccharothrix coeruleofusca]
MDLTATAADLAAAASDVARLLPARVLDPVLAGLVLRADPHGVELAGNDREHAVRLTRPATVHTEGAVLVPARPLAETLRGLADHQVRLVVEGSRLAVRTQSARFALPLLDLAAHPGVLPLPPLAGRAPGAALAGALAAVSTAASKDDALPVFTGVRVHAAGERLELICTDRYRMAFASLPWSGGALDVLAPAAALAEVSRRFGGGEVAVHADADRVALAWAGGSASTALLAAPFPDDRARKLLEADAESTVLVEADVLAGAVRRAAPYSGPHGAVTIQVDDGELRVRGSDPQAGESEESVKASVDGNRLTKSFQARYLADALRAFGGGRVELRIRDGLRSTVLTCDAGEDGVELTYLVVPLRTP